MRGRRRLDCLCHPLRRHVQRPFFGIYPSERLAFLHVSGICKVESGQIIQARIIFGLPELMRQARSDPFGAQPGLETFSSGPSAHKGLLSDSNQSARSLDLVKAILGDLVFFDPAFGGSNGQRRGVRNGSPRPLSGSFTEPQRRWSRLPDRR